MASRSVNKVILIGNLGKDPEQKFTPSGQAVTKFSIATTDRWKDKTSGEFQERTEWHNIVCWARLAEVAGQYLTKGSSVYIEGRLQTRTWDDKEGKKHYMTEVIANEMMMLGGRGKEGGGRSAAAGAQGGASGPGEDYNQEPRFAPSGAASTEITDDDIPF